MKLYLAGPMRGFPLLNFETFMQYATFLRNCGYEVVNPVEMDMADGLDFTSDETISQTIVRDEAGNISEDYYLDRDMELLASCDAVALLPQWENSSGTRREINQAIHLDMRIRNADKWVFQAIQHHSWRSNGAMQTQESDAFVSQLKLIPVDNS
jgi:nucleoside 2-deoxyribosyltransferase